MRKYFSGSLLVTGLWAQTGAGNIHNARNRVLFYRRMTSVPKHRFNYNWLLDLLFGQGKALARNAKGWAQRAIGGWQLAGNGSLTSRWWPLPATNYDLGEVEMIYGKNFPVEDCRSGVCFPAYLYGNGYIPANRINSYDAQGRPNGVMGVPDSYVSSNRPLIATPKDGGNPSDPMYRFYETNTVWVPMANENLQQVAYVDNLHPWHIQYKLGPMAFALNSSLFTTIRLERFNVRFNADFFNVFNLAGTPLPGGDGLIQMRNSAYAPRQLQLTLRVTW